MVVAVKVRVVDDVEKVLEMGSPASMTPLPL